MKIVKYLSDTEIMNWNNRLENTPYIVIPRYHTHSSFPTIVFKQKTTTGLGNFLNDPQSEVITLDPHMKFQFSFSVAKNRVDNFFNIFNKWFSKIETKTYFQDRSNRWRAPTPTRTACSTRASSRRLRRAARWARAAVRHARAAASPRAKADRKAR